MPDLDTHDARWRGRLLTVLFWAGIGLAPLAGLLLLLGSGNGASRGAAILTVLAVMSIGLSFALRPDPATLRLQMEETLLEEIDMLRADVRNDIAAAARATHQSFGERLQSVQQMAEALRAERAGYGANGHAPVAHAVAPPPPAPPEPVPVAPPVAPQTQGRASVDPGAIRGARHQPDGHRSVPAGRANVPAGVFRHTETVQVTTRSTYVDEHGHNGDRSRAHEPRYGGAGAGNGAPAWSSGGGRDRAYEESWTDQKLRERYGYQSGQDDRGRGREADRSGGRGDGARGDGVRGDAVRIDAVRGDGVRGDGAAGDGRRGDDRWSGSGEWRTVMPQSVNPRAAGRRDDPPPPEVRAGTRWAAVRTDERGGRELQVGERRAARHADGIGTEWRVEDRWAAVRRDDDRSADHQIGDQIGDLAPDPGRRALPAASAEPSWNDGWEEPVRESRAHAYRGEDRGHSGPTPRRVGFELSDERWR